MRSSFGDHFLSDISSAWLLHCHSETCSRLSHCVPSGCQPSRVGARALRAGVRAPRDGQVGLLLIDETHFPTPVRHVQLIRECLRGLFPASRVAPPQLGFGNRGARPVKGLPVCPDRTNPDCHRASDESG